MAASSRGLLGADAGLEVGVGLGEEVAHRRAADTARARTRLRAQCHDHETALRNQ